MNSTEYSKAICNDKHALQHSEYTLPEAPRRGLDILWGCIRDHGKENELQETLDSLVADMRRCGAAILSDELRADEYLRNPVAFLEAHNVEVSPVTQQWLRVGEPDATLSIISLVTLNGDDTRLILDGDLPPEQQFQAGWGGFILLVIVGLLICCAAGVCCVKDNSWNAEYKI